MQLAAEETSSKSLISMVCDATFWIDRGGDTILRSSRQLDALLGCRVEGLHFSKYLPESEIPRFHNAMSTRQQYQHVMLLPTSVLREGRYATNVDLFIVPCKLASSISESQSSDIPEVPRLLIGLRLAQTD